MSQLKLSYNNINVYIAIFKSKNVIFSTKDTGIILCMRPTNERRRYIVTSSLIGWVHAQYNICIPIAENIYGMELYAPYTSLCSNVYIIIYI